MDTLFTRVGRPLRIHFDDTRITAVAIRQLSWRVEQGGGAIVGQPSNADVLVVDPAAPWVFHDYLRTRRVELRPSVVLAFWIPLCLTTRSLIWVNHPYWQQVVIPSERPSHSEIPPGITAYSSFLAGITYSRIAPFSSTKTTPRSSNTLDRDSSVISNLDNSDLEVSQSLEPGVSSDDEPLEHPRKHKRPRPGTPSTAPSSQRPSEAQRDEAEVSGILPVEGEASLPPGDVDMSSPPPFSEPVQQPQKGVDDENVASTSRSAPTRSAKNQPPAAPHPSSAQRHTAPRHSSLPHAEPSPDLANIVEPEASPEPDSAQPATETVPSAAPQYVVVERTSPVASETVTAANEAYIPPTLDSSPPPSSEELNSTPLESSPKVPNVLTHELSTGATAALDKLEAPSASGLTKPSRKQVGSTEATVTPPGTSSTTESAKPRASTSTAPPSTPASVPKSSVPFKKSSVSTSSTGLKYVPDSSSGTQNSKPSPSNATKIKVRPKMRPVPPAEGNDSVASSSSRANLAHPKSKLNIQPGTNGSSTKPRPSAVASATGSAPLVKLSQNSTSTATALADSPVSTASSSVTNAAGSMPASATSTPATTVANDTPKSAPGSSLARPKKLIIRSPTISTTTLYRPSASVSPVQTRHPAPTSSSQSHPLSPEVHPIYGPPPTPPTPTPEQLASIAAKRPAWTKEEDQYIIDYMNWTFAQDPFASTAEILKDIAANCLYRPASHWRNRFRTKEDSIYMNEVPVLFERLTNKTSGLSHGKNNNKTLEILSGTRTRSRGTVDYVDSSDDENAESSDDDSGGPPRKKTRRSQAGGRRRSDRMG